MSTKNVIIGGVEYENISKIKVKDCDCGEYVPFSCDDDATATPSDILTGETAYANGAKITGTIPTYSGETNVIENKTINTAGKYVSSDIVISVPTRKLEQEKVVTITENGNTDVLPDTNKVLSKVSVVTNVPSIPTQTKAVTITENGTTEVLPDNGYALSQVNIITNVPSANENPVEITTDSEMDSLLIAANVGKVYKFTGTTGTYENGKLYTIGED